MAVHIDIFILMAGLGDRFKREGYPTPKPLIKFKGKPLFSWALRSVKDLLPQANLHLVLCAEDNIHEKVEVELARLTDLNFHTVHIISLPKRTSGPLDTAVQAVRQTSVQDRSHPVIFCDCDVYFESSSWIKAVNRLAAGQSSDDGLLVSFNSDLPKYSYVKFDSEGHASEVAEKKVISHTAITGAYTFGNAKLFLQTANKVLDNTATVFKEHYISHVVNELIHSQKKISVYETEKIIQLGTPEELEASEKLDIK